MQPLILSQVLIVLVNNESRGNQVSSHWSTDKGSVKLCLKVDS